MKIYTSFPKDLPPTALTIGTFDGIHVGHRALLSHMRSLSPHRTVLTFTNHPLSFLQGSAPSLLTPLPFKLSLLEALGVDAVVALPFDRHLQTLSFEILLEKFPLTHLVLGENDAFGHKKGGTPEAVLRFAQAWGFSVEYLPKQQANGFPVSSSRIRTLIGEGNLLEAEELLGRPHALFFPPLQSSPPVLPPDGLYTVFQGERKAELLIEQGQCTSLTPTFRKPFLVTFS